MPETGQGVRRICKTASAFLAGAP